MATRWAFLLVPLVGLVAVSGCGSKDSPAVASYVAQAKVASPGLSRSDALTIRKDVCADVALAAGAGASRPYRSTDMANGVAHYVVSMMQHGIDEASLARMRTLANFASTTC